MLDLAAAAAQVAELARELSSWEETFPARRDLALARLRQFAGEPLPSLPASLERWVAVPERERQDERVEAPHAPERLTVIAVDGSQIEPDFLVARELFQISVAVGHEQGEAIWFGQAVHVVGRNEGPGSRHGLYDHARIAWKIFRDEPGQQPSPAVVESARGGADNDANLFSLVEGVGLSVSKCLTGQEPKEQNKSKA